MNRVTIWLLFICIAYSVRTTFAETKWRRDARCGDRFRLLSGKKSECNPNGGYPCCSNYGWCGNTAAHCSCKGCTDYRPRPGKEPAPGSITLLFSSQTLGYWGKWGAEQACPSGQYVYGFQLKSEKYQGKNSDDTGLNGIKLLCQGGGSVTSKTERWGQWLASRACRRNEPVTGFQIQIEKRQGGSDDTAANNVNLWCKGNYYIKGVANTKYGSWSKLLRCPAGKVVVGLQTRVEASCGSRCDDTALNGVKLLCGNYKG